MIKNLDINSSYACYNAPSISIIKLTFGILPAILLNTNCTCPQALRQEKKACSLAIPTKGLDLPESPARMGKQCPPPHTTCIKSEFFRRSIQRERKRVDNPGIHGFCMQAHYLLLIQDSDQLFEPVLFQSMQVHVKSPSSLSTAANICVL